MNRAARSMMLFATVGAFAGCTDGPSAPALFDDAAFAMGGVHGPGMVPFKGYITINGQPGGSPGPASDPGCAARNAAGAGAKFWIPIPTRTGLIDATQVGEGTIVSNGCIEVLSFPFTLDGEVVITSGNGDQLFYSGSDPFNPFDPSPVGSATIDGGTGRFNGATGRFDFQILTNPNILPILVQIDGVISNGRSGR